MKPIANDTNQSLSVLRQSSVIAHMQPPTWRRDDHRGSFADRRKPDN